MDTSAEALNKRIEALRSGYDGYSAALLERNKSYLRLFSPEFDPSLREHDQWPDKVTAADTGKARNSYNIARAVVELWTALEAYPLPGIQWMEDYVPSVVPAVDPQENEQREQVHRATKLIARQMATMREHALEAHFRRGRLERHYYRTIQRKNTYGHGWLQVLPDEGRKTFRFKSAFDPSTVYPVWSAWDQNDLAAILCCTRRSARTLSEQYPDAVQVDDDGLAVESGYYQATASTARGGIDRGYVWVEDYWLLDQSYSQPVSDSDEPVSSLVVNAIRVNGKIVERAEYPGWRSIPYFLFENDNLRDRFGFSDVGTVAPIQDTINRFLSQQADVIAGESRPKWKFQGPEGSTKKVELADDGIVYLDEDEDINQLQTHLDVFPTQVHGQQIMDMLARITGLNDSVFGRIVASQNSGRALATAWRSVSSRLVPRLQSDAESLDRVCGFMLDVMELNNWDDARDLYNGNRDFAPSFPNQEPRDFMEVATVAINKMNAGLIDAVGAMEETGENSPDEMDERVRADYVDPVRHPEKAQSFLLLQQLKQRLQIEAAQFGMEMQQAQAAAANTPPAGAPGGANGGPAAADQARTQAAQQAAPTVPPGQGPQPATQSGQTANQTKVSTLVQNGGPAQNRIVQQTQY